MKLLKGMNWGVVIALCVLFAGLAAAQELIIEPAADFNDVLNTYIDGDTTDTGDRADVNRVYVLRRDGIYFVNDELRNDDWPIYITAEEGEGQRPVIYLIEDVATGSFPGYMFRTKGDLILKNVLIVGFLEPDPEEINNIPGGLIRTDAAGYDIIIDNCIFTQTRGQHIRTQSATRAVKVTNSMFCNMGDLGRSNFGAGKAFDFRDTSCDTALFVNNTFVNFQDRIIRHRSSTAAIENFIFDHNTLVNGMSYHGTLALGWVGNSSTITNNLFLDTFVAAQDTDMVRQSEFDESGELDDYGFGKMTWIFSVPNDSTEWTVANNYYSVSDSVQAFYNVVGATDEAFRGEGDAFTDHILAQSNTEDVIKEAIEVANRPAPMLAMARWYRNPNGGNKTKETTNFVRETDDFDRRGWRYFADTLDCSYGTAAAAYTAADGGYPVGDLNWYPSAKSDWETWTTDVEEIPGAMPTAFDLEQNYPNPFNPTTMIGFSMSKTAKVKVEVYNIMGQRVASLVNGMKTAGRYQTEFDASELSSGVYVVRMSAGGRTVMRKMILQK